MGNFEQVFVEYHQFQVNTGSDVGDLPLHTIGDDLVHLGGESTLTVIAGLHTGWVAVRVATMSEPPDDDAAGWDAASEATLWCPDGRVAVCGLMGDCPDAFRDIAAPRPGLLRVQVRARNRRPEDAASPKGRAEEYEVLTWPVHEDVGVRTMRVDDLSAGALSPHAERAERAARAAGWAVVRLVTEANPDPREVSLRAAAALPAQPDPRVDVRRNHTMPGSRARGFVHRPAEYFGFTPDGDDLVLRAGDVEARLSPVNRGVEPEDTFVAEWRWLAAPGSTAAVPDVATSTVELGLRPHPIGGTAQLTLLHRGVRGQDAVPLGLLWDHLVHRAELVADGAVVPPDPWQPLFDDIAAKAAQEAAAARRSWARWEAQRWGGRPPSDRLRELRANTVGLARLDRGLLDALADATPQQQRDVARWAARRACTASGLITVDWIADGLSAIERGAPPPPPFHEVNEAWRLLWADPRVPSTVVTTPDGIPNYSQQAAALPAIFAATAEDPLVAAVDALHAAAYAYGSDHPELLDAARSTFPVLNGPQ